jgi:hypothetical protein
MSADECAISNSSVNNYLVYRVASGPLGNRAFNFNLEPLESDLGRLASRSFPDVQLPPSSRTPVTESSAFLLYGFPGSSSGRIAACAQCCSMASTGEAWGSARFLCLSACSADHSCSRRTRRKSCGRRRQARVIAIVRALAPIARA